VNQLVLPKVSQLPHFSWVYGYWTE